MTTHHTSRRTRGIIAASAAALAALVLAGCAVADSAGQAPTSAGPASQEPAAGGDDLLTELRLDGRDAASIIDSLDATALAERPTAYMASIRPDELLIISADERQTSLPMPDDEFYVSFAPYVSTTHECYFHSLTTCTGELQNVDLEVVVTDVATGDVLIDETRTTFDNGFVGLWLPRDITATVTFAYDGRSATTEVSTADSDDATCVTTMQLA